MFVHMSINTLVSQPNGCVAIAPPAPTPAGNY